MRPGADHAGIRRRRLQVVRCLLRRAPAPKSLGERPRRSSPPPRNIHVVAAASPRPASAGDASAEYPRRRRGVAAICLRGISARPRASPQARSIARVEQLRTRDRAGPSGATRLPETGKMRIPGGRGTDRGGRGGGWMDGVRPGAARRADAPPRVATTRLRRDAAPLEPRRRGGARVWSFGARKGGRTASWRSCLADLRALAFVSRWSGDWVGVVIMVPGDFGQRGLARLWVSTGVRPATATPSQCDKYETVMCASNEGTRGDG